MGKKDDTAIDQQTAHIRKDMDKFVNNKNSPIANEAKLNSLVDKLESQREDLLKLLKA